jgi:hypothetical protein
MEVSIYSCLTNKALENLHMKFTRKYGKVLTDDSRSLEERRIALMALLPSNEAEQEREFSSIREFAKEYVYRQLKEFALIICLAMEKRADYSPWDEERTYISFCRNILNVPTGRSVFDTDFCHLRLILEKCDERNGNKTGEEYLDYCKKFSLEIFGRKYADHYKLNDLFEILKDDSFLWITTTNYYSLRFVFGQLQKNEFEGNKIMVIRKEYIRSPQMVLTIAAEVYQDTNIIRRESMAVIFYNKWLNYFSQAIFERRYALLHINSSIREGLKKFAMNYYGVSNKLELNAVKDVFLSSMVDGIVFHEAGHHYSNAHMERLHFDFSYVFHGEHGNTGNTLNEMLADWATQEGHRKGAFTRFLERGRINPRQTTGDIYVYLSDNWFLDEEDEEFMGLLSEITLGTTLYIIRPDSTIDFDLLEREKDRIYAFFMQKYINLINSLLAVIRDSTYDFGLKKLDFSQLELKVEEMHKDTSNAKTLEELRHESFYWKNIIGFLEEYSAEEGWIQYQKILAYEASLLKQEILEMITNGHAEKYNYSLRNYIVKRCREIGIIERASKEKSGKVLIA